MVIGVLALQGAFREHINMIHMCNADAIEIRLPSELKEIDGLIIPGGESTTITKLLKEYNFQDEIRNLLKEEKPIWGTCAGAILLAREIDGEKNQLFDGIDIGIKRNAYGRQVESRETELEIDAVGIDPFRAIFIRAPVIDQIGPEVLPLAYYQDKVVMARQGHVLVCTFHPELTSDKRIHRYFLDMAGGRIQHHTNKDLKVCNF